MMIKLICLDMDGVLVPPDNFWLQLHKAFGTLEEGKRLTDAYLRTDYNRLVEEVVGRLWLGRNAEPYHDLVNSLPFTHGIKEFFATLDTFTGPDGKSVPRVIISGGSYDVAARIAAEYPVDFIFANQLVIKNGVVSGEFHWPVGMAGDSKRRIIEQLCDDLNILPSEVLHVGDSDGDLEAFRIVGTSIAFNATSAELKREASYVVEGDLRAVVPILQNIKDAQAR